MDVKTYMDIKTWENSRQIRFSAPIIYWSVPLSSTTGGDGVKEVDGGIVILDRYKFHFIRVQDNLM